MCAVLAFTAAPLTAAQAQGGSVVGTVTDRTTKAPLEGTLVTIAGTRLGAVTDGRGHFVIRGVTPGTASVLVRRIGYRQGTASVQVAAGETATADFVLDVSAVELNQVVTTGTGGAVEKRELGAPIAIVDVSQIQANKPSDDMTQLL